MGSPVLHDCCDCDCLRFRISARLSVAGATTYRAATISHTQDCLSQPATAVTPFNRLFSTRDPRTFTLSVVAAPLGGDYAHAGWTINYADGEIATAGPGDLTLEIEQSIGHGTLIIAEFSDDIEEFQRCSSFNLDVPQYLRVTLPSFIDTTYGCEDIDIPSGTPAPCGVHTESVFNQFDFFGRYNKYVPPTSLILTCHSIRKHIFPPTGGRGRTGVVDVVVYKYTNTHGTCLEVELSSFWKLITDRFSASEYNWRSNAARWELFFGCVPDNSLYFKPVVDAVIKLSFINENGVLATRKFSRSQSLMGSLSSPGFSESALLGLYRGIDETSCTGSGNTNAACVGTLDETFNQVWGGNGLPNMAWGLGPPHGPLQIFDSIGGKVPGVGDIGAFSNFYDTETYYDVDEHFGSYQGSQSYNELALCHNHFSTGGFSVPYYIHTVDPNQVQAASKCALQYVPSFGQVYTYPNYPEFGPHLENTGISFSICPEGWSGTQYGVLSGSIAATVTPVSELLPGEFPNDEDKCQCLTLNDTVSFVSAGLYVHEDYAGPVVDEPCIIRCGPTEGQQNYPINSSDVFPPKIRLILPPKLDFRFLDGAPGSCDQYASFGNLYQRTSGAVHVMSTDCSKVTKISSLAAGGLPFDIRAWRPFEETYWLFAAVVGKLVIWSAEYTFGVTGPGGCTPTTRVFLDVGWIANTGPQWWGCGPDAVEKRILFTQCRIVDVSLGGSTLIEQSDFHAVNFAAEFSYPDFDNDELNSVGILDNAWNWQSHNFIFADFYNDQFYGDHPNFGFPQSCDFSYSPQRYRYSAAKKTLGGAVEDFCPDPQAEPCYYPILPGSTPTSPPLYSGIKRCAYGQNHRFGFRVSPWFSDPVDPRCGPDNSDFARYDV